MNFSLSGRATALWRSYERQLERQPIPTQMTTSLLLWGLGDFVAQKVVEQRPHIETRRLGLTSAFGATFMGPVGHYWYIGLDAVCSKMYIPGTKRFFAAKVLLDSLVLGPVYVLAFYAWGAIIIDQTGIKGFTDKVKKDFLPTFLAEMSLWPLFQSINFTRIPIEHQLLAVNCATLIDASFLSWARTQDDWVGTLVKHISGQPQTQVESTASSLPDGQEGKKKKRNAHGSEGSK